MGRSWDPKGPFSAWFLALGVIAVEIGHQSHREWENAPKGALRGWAGGGAGDAPASKCRL